MMRWTSGEMTKTSEDRAATPMQYLLDAVVDLFARHGSRSLVLAVAAALIVAVLFLGLSADETAAGGRLCC